MNRCGRLWLVVLGSLLLLGLLSGCDEQIEKKIGDISAASVESEYRVVNDPLLTDWINTMGHTMLGYVVRQNLPYEFKVIDTDLVNAFAAPYGHVYVTTGLLDFCESEQEVWGVIGHEIGHVSNRHSISAVKRGFLYNIGLAILGGQSRGLADAAGLGLGLLSLRYSRENEYEADDMGRRLSFAAGYDPRGQVDFFGRLLAKYEKSRPSSIEVMFRTHPTTDKRAARQMAMPELSNDNPDALLQTGRGYAHRYEFRRASDLLAKAVELRPTDAESMVSLGEVQLHRGDLERARRSFEAALRIRSSNYAAEGVRLATTTSLPTVTPASDSEGQRALLLLADAGRGVSRAQQAAADAGRQMETLTAAYHPSIKGAQSVIESLFGLADSQAELSEGAESLVSFANGVVNRALDPVYSVERQREGLSLCAAQVAESAAQIQAKLAAAKDGRLAAGDVTVLERTLRETQRAADDVQTALEELTRAQPAVKAAAEAAEEATGYVDRIMRGDRTAATAQRAQLAAQLTEARALTALAATAKAKQVVDRATLRSLISRVNLAATGADSALRPGLDGMVAHFTMQRPEVVAKLRGEGVGYGEMALILSAAYTNKANPADLMSLVGGARSLVDQINSAGARTEGALVVLKYLARAVEYETKSGS
jgi:Zn-dependent protease with chaperone function